MRGQMAHLDAEVLAEFRAGLITGRRGARITAHLAGCDRCTALDDQLAGVTALLASVPVPDLPDRVAQRLDTVLAAEVASSDHAERAGLDRPVHPATGHRRTPRHGLRLLSLRVLAPVAVVVLAAGGYGLSLLPGPSGQMTTSSSAGRSPATGSSATGSSAAGAAAKAAAPSAGRGRLAPSSPAHGAGRTTPLPQRLTPANFTLVASTTDFSSTPAVLKRQVENELSTTPPAGATRPVPAQLRACVQNLVRGASLVRVESARFEGRPATLVVARTGPDDTAWIAGPDCSATSRDVLATTSVPPGISEP